MRDGTLIYARGFGYADVENKTTVQPDALFRIASVSKPLTSAAIMKLVEEGKLRLNDRVVPYIAYLPPAPGATADPRWEQITIRHLLDHSGGWDRAKPNGGFDPIDRPAIAAAAVNAPAPASPETLIRSMKGLPLDFNPGDKFAYSNFGFIILGRVIERVSGMPYEEYVRTRLLEPVGARRTQQGKSRTSEALAGEVKYYYPGFNVSGPLVPSVFPGGGLVPLNYGGFYLEAGDASGAWVSSTVHLRRRLRLGQRADHCRSGLAARSGVTDHDRSLSRHDRRSDPGRTGLIVHAIAGLVPSPPPNAPRTGPTVALNRAPALSAREVEVLQELVNGARNSEIAGTLGISERTVKAHLGSIYQKLGVRTRSAAVAAAVQRKLV